MNVAAACRLESPAGYIPPALPLDESARLNELHHLRILDTPGEERFDRVVRLAATVFQAPIAYVALIDHDRQWFKSRLGMEPEETPRHASFCGHAILQDQPLIVADARRDLRFAGNPLVIGEPFVRFYAGQPVRGPGGHKIGTLCVLDRNPRTFSEGDIEVLQQLGAVVEDELALRLALEWQREAVRAGEALAAKERDLSHTVRELQAAQERSDELLQNILPSALAAELRAKGSVTPVHYEEVAVLFADFSGFTSFANTASAAAVVTELNECFCHFDWVMAKHGVEKLKTIGDGYLAVAGMPEARPDDALRLLRAALEIRDYIAARRAEHSAAGIAYWDVRVGLHTGPLVAGVVGVRKIAYDVWGDTVNTASRIESASEAGKVNASETFHARVAAHVESEARGKIHCKHKGDLEMFFIHALKGA